MPPSPGALPPTTAEALGPSARSNQRTVRAVHEVQHPRHAGTRRPDARVAGSDSVGAGCHLRSVTNDRDHAVRAVQMAVEQPFEIRIGTSARRGEWTTRP